MKTQNKGKKYEGELNQEIKYKYQSLLIINKDGDSKLELIQNDLNQQNIKDITFMKAYPNYIKLNKYIWFCSHNNRFYEIK